MERLREDLNCDDCIAAQLMGGRRCRRHLDLETANVARYRYRNGFPTKQMMKEDILADTVLPEPTPGDFGVSVEDYLIAQEMARSMGAELVVLRARAESHAGRALEIGKPVRLRTEVNESGRAVRLRVKELLTIE